MTPLELKRQLFHIAFGLAIIVLLYYGFLNAYLLLVMATLGLVLSYAAKHRRLPLVHKFLDHCERSEDIKAFPGRGVIYYALGCAIAVAYFPKDVAMAGIMVLALGDSASHLFGRFYGKRKHPFNPKKLVEGWAAGIVAGFFGAWIFVSPLEALLASAIAMTAETAEWGVDRRILDDNLFIPVMAAVVIAVMRIF